MVEYHEWPCLKIKSRAWMRVVSSNQSIYWVGSKLFLALLSTLFDHLASMLRQASEQSKSEESCSYLDQQALEDAVSFKRKQQRQRICDCHGVSADECNCYQCVTIVLIRKVSGLGFVGHLQDRQQSKANVLFNSALAKWADSELEPHQSGNSLSCKAVCAMWCYDCSLSSKGGVEALALGPHPFTIAIVTSSFPNWGSHG